MPLSAGAKSCTPRHRAPVVSIDSGGHRARAEARRNELVEQFRPMVSSMAAKLRRRLPASCDLDDLIGTGELALTVAASRFRPDEYPGVSFGMYARQVVMGALLNSISGRHWKNNTHAPIDTVIGIRSAAPSPDAHVATRQIEAVIADMPVEHRAVMYAKYGADEPTLEEIGRRMGYSQAWVSERHKEAIGILREVLQVAV